MKGLICAVLILGVTGCAGIRRTFIAWFGDAGKYAPEGTPTQLKGTFAQIDQKSIKINVSMNVVATSLKQPTAFAFFPDDNRKILALEKQGRAVLINDGRGSTALQLQVNSDSEMGLLGLAFHPKFAQNRFVFLCYNPGGTMLSRVSRFTANVQNLIDKSSEKVIFEMKQPYANHDGGDLAFGPDSYLYLAWGDGGWRDDIHGHGQNRKTHLGTIMRIDVDQPSPGKGYSVPADNPFVKNTSHLPETWAYGFRNPWRITFLPDGRIIAADVGQNKYEEVTVVSAGENHGWNVKEGFHCFKPESGCKGTGLVDPVHEYKHPIGASITGGHVYAAKTIKELRNHYIFADFISGRIWALDMSSLRPQQNNRAKSLGKWPLLISTFARDSRGEVYLADFGSGRILKITAIAAN